MCWSKKNAAGYPASVVLDSLNQYIACATELSTMLPDLFRDRMPPPQIDTYKSGGGYNAGTLHVRKEIVEKAYNDICRILHVAAFESRESASIDSEPILRVLRVLDRFPRVARQFRHRYADRNALTIDDEYDVQYCFKQCF